MLRPMSIAPETAMVRLRRFYRDANHCDPTSNWQALSWALKPEQWAEHQIRFRNWSWYVCEATIKQCRILSNRLQRAADAAGLTPEAFAATLPFPESPELEVEA